MERTALMLTAIVLAAALGMAGCTVAGSGGGGGNYSGSLYIAGEVIKGDPDATDPAPSDLTAGIFVATSTDLLNDSVGDATVTVNAVPNDSFFALIFWIYTFALNTPPAVDAGDTVTLAVSYGTTTVTGSAAMPEQPVITAPAGGSNHNAAAAVTVTWNTFAVTPEGVKVVVDATYTVDPDGYDSGLLAGTVTTCDIPAGTLKAATTGIVIEVVAGNAIAAFTGNADPASAFAVEHEAVVTVDTN